MDLVMVQGFLFKRRPIKGLNNSSSNKLHSWLWVLSEVDARDILKSENDMGNAAQSLLTSGL